MAEIFKYEINGRCIETSTPLSDAEMRKLADIPEGLTMTGAKPSVLGLIKPAMSPIQRDPWGIEIAERIELFDDVVECLEWAISHMRVTPRNYRPSDFEKVETVLAKAKSI